MRKLTIRRAKRFVACLATMKVYIEDPTADDMTINGCPCRKLGTLKNGQEKSFFISEEAARVFVIADKLSKDFCNEYYPVPAGQEDLVLSGRNCFNPANGNAFRFDGVDDPAVLENRKKATNKGILVLVIAVVIGMTVGGMIGGTIAGVKIAQSIIQSTSQPKQFQAGGLKITLTNQFEETTIDGCLAAFQSQDVLVMVHQEFRQAGVSVKDYANAVQKANGHRASLYSDENFLYYEYVDTDKSTGEQYHNLIMFRANERYFYAVHFVVPKDEWNDKQNSVMEWARTVDVY